MLNVISTCLGCLGVIIVATGFSNILKSVLMMMSQEYLMELVIV